MLQWHPSQGYGIWSKKLVFVQTMSRSARQQHLCNQNDSLTLDLCNNRTVWNKRTGQFIFDSLRQAGCPTSNKLVVVVVVVGNVHTFKYGAIWK